MIDDHSLKAALRILDGRLHQAVGDKRCGCGPCAHWVAIAARRAGIRHEDLRAALPPAAKPQARRRPGVRPLRTSICESGTIRVRGRDVDPSEGLGILLSRLHNRS